MLHAGTILPFQSSVFESGISVVLPEVSADLSRPLLVAKLTQCLAPLICLSPTRY